MSNSRSPQDLLDTGLRLLCFAVVLPYKSVYREFTRDPLLALITTHNDQIAITGLKLWRDMKLREAYYVQVAVRDTSLLLSLPACSSTALHPIKYMNLPN